MKSCLIAVVLGSLVAGWLAPAVAKDKIASRAKDPSQVLQKKLDRADLPSDVREKAKKVLTEHGPKLRDANEAREAVLTAEQEAAAASAKKSAKEAGKKGKEMAAAVEAAMKLTDEQKTKLSAADRKLAEAKAELNAALQKVLSPEQQAAVGLKVKKTKKQG